MNKTKEEKARRLTGQPLYAPDETAESLAGQLTTEGLRLLLAAVDERLKDHERSVADHLSALTPAERKGWIETHKTPTEGRP